jgi:hypothetical protein
MECKSSAVQRSCVIQNDAAFEFGADQATRAGAGGGAMIGGSAWHGSSSWSFSPAVQHGLGARVAGKRATPRIWHAAIGGRPTDLASVPTRTTDEFCAGSASRVLHRESTLGAEFVGFRQLGSKGRRQGCRGGSRVAESHSSRSWRSSACVGEPPATRMWVWWGRRLGPYGGTPSRATARAKIGRVEVLVVRTRQSISRDRAERTSL